MSLEKIEKRTETDFSFKAAYEEFNYWIKPSVIEMFGVDDVTAMQQAWNNWTDDLRQDGGITVQQYESWDNPF